MSCTKDKERQRINIRINIRINKGEYKENGKINWTRAN